MAIHCGGSSGAESTGVAPKTKCASPVSSIEAPRLENPCAKHVHAPPASAPAPAAPSATPEATPAIPPSSSTSWTPNQTGSAPAPTPPASAQAKPDNNPFTGFATHVLGSFHDGGKVPKTGTYQLKKGEVILSTDTVKAITQIAKQVMKQSKEKKPTQK